MKGLSMSIYQWAEGAVPSEMPVKQVYGIVFTEDGKILLRKDGKKYSLPGGKPEPFDLNMEATLTRELAEEVNVSVSDIVMVGYQLVDEQNGTPLYAQVRMAAKLKRVGDQRPDPDTGRTYERVFVSPAQAIDLLGWGEVGELQIRSAVTKAKGFLGTITEDTGLSCEETEAVKASETHIL